jgi:hypothetical protein
MKYVAVTSRAAVDRGSHYLTPFRSGRSGPRTYPRADSGHHNIAKIAEVESEGRFW